VLDSLDVLDSMTRKPFFEVSPLARVWVSSRRLPMFQGAFKSLLRVVRLGRVQGEGAP